MWLVSLVRFAAVGLVVLPLVLAGSTATSHASQIVVRPSLPVLSTDPPRLRGAQLAEWNWSDPTLANWNLIGDFPRSGGNAFRIFLTPFAEGRALRPGQALTFRLAESLQRYAAAIEWALDRRLYVLIAFNPYYAWPPPAADWPDDGRSLWKDASARDELVAAWTDLAIRYKGRDGIIFDLINEPHGIAPDEDNALLNQVLNSLYPRLVNAIRAQDPDRWLVLSPIWSDADFLPGLATVPAPKLMYTFHFYDPHYFTHQGQGGNPPAGTVGYPGATRGASWEAERYWDRSVLEERMRPALDYRNANQVRMLLGEYGASSFAMDASRARWFADVLALAEQHEFDHLYFQFEARHEIGPGAWTFETLPFESVITSVLALNFPETLPGTLPTGAYEAALTSILIDLLLE